MPVIAFFGPAGTFTEMAMNRLLGTGAGPLAGVADDVERLPVASPTAVIEAVRTGAADFGCVPVESSIEGSVPATMDALVPASAADRVQVFAETVLDIAFTIAAKTGLAPAEVRTIAAYPVAQAQVRATVAERFPNAEFVLASSNSAAAHDVAEGAADAAVTTPVAAESFGLRALADGVADSADAATRFVLLGRPGPATARTGNDRTSVIVDLPNRPGSLLGALDEFAARGIDLTRIESRPRRSSGPGLEYRFFIDVIGHIDDAAIGEALRALHRTVEQVVFLGSWPVDGVGGTPPPDHRDSEAWFTRLRDGGR
ncbi:prephenate dehydratase [Gordonia araii NBRC 100433]|uniref:Prephenate dehydratase n=1 Tax=Gordonia araii NBRC 100433 TaxID=1073574 RepID=G7H1Z3_9ACTN|nr:prephenate dehydratase [Gordonia araii]NNG97201.1 prephenate dehydratase [Gordonia araii NBRC 100433]GAB09868.1 prephenate dehydratase [Gordonia araii NBRC 100433]